MTGVAPEAWAPVPREGIRIATWNLERPTARSWKKVPRQRQQMRAVGADVWVLTETRASVTPDPEYHAAHCPPHPTRRPDEDERWVSIWSRWPLHDVGIDASPRGSIAASTDTPLGPLLVYGTVLPWAHEPDEAGSVTLWARHYEEIARQSQEWANLRARHPSAGFVLAGDFNQTHDGSHWYGTRKGRGLLADALAQARVALATDEDVVAAGKLRQHHLIDHICLNDEWLSRFSVSVRCWEPTASDGTRLSDHPGVAIDICV